MLTVLVAGELHAPQISDVSIMHVQGHTSPWWSQQRWDGESLQVESEDHRSSPRASDDLKDCTMVETSEKSLLLTDSVDNVVEPNAVGTDEDRSWIIIDNYI